MLDYLDIVFVGIIVTLMISSVSLAIQVYILLKNRKKQKEQLVDAKYVQKYFYAVGSCLDKYKSPENAPSYKAIAADIYRHIPSKHWMLLEKIDQAIANEKNSTAWESLKLLSQFLAVDGIEPIHPDISDEYTKKEE